MIINMRQFGRSLRVLHSFFFFHKLDLSKRKPRVKTVEIHRYLFRKVERLERTIMEILYFYYRWSVLKEFLISIICFHRIVSLTVNHC